MAWIATTPSTPTNHSLSDQFNDPIADTALSALVEGFSALLRATCRRVSHPPERPLQLIDRVQAYPFPVS